MQGYTQIQYKEYKKGSQWTGFEPVRENPNR